MTRLRVAVPDSAWRDRFADLEAEVELLVWDPRSRSEQPDGRIDLVLLPYLMGHRRLAGIPHPERLSVLQAQALGYDTVDTYLPPGLRYCNAVGVHEGSTAELAIALLLASTRRLDVYAREVGQWNRVESPTLIDARVMILGFGGIGTRIEARLDGFDAEIIRVASAARTDERGPIHGAHELPALLPTVDAVIVAVPLQDATVHLIDDDFLAALKDGAAVVNVSRGLVADADAIVRAGGRIRYATDVTDPEPLPPDHPLWTTPGVLISPHVGGAASSMYVRMERQVRTQIAHLLAGEPPEHVVVET